MAGLLQSGSKHPLSDRPNQPGLFCQRHELAWRDRPADRVIPADERLECGNLFAGGPDDGLIVHRKLAAIDRLPKVIFKQLPFRSLAMHGWLVKAVLAAPGILRRIECEVGVADERVGAGSARIADHDPDRRADGDLVTLDRIGPR